jgi:leader peptidase (prepilin peptidase)/N-methyltransferase
MEWLMLILAFIFGSVIGSFINVLVDRIDTKESPFKGRSFCPYCHKSLAWWEMVPVLNFFYLKGRCSMCHHKLSWQYPLVEFLTGLFFSLATWRFLRFPLINLHIFLSFHLETVLLYLNFAFWLYWIFVLIAISIYDLKKYLILSEVLFPALIVTVIWKIVLGVFLQIKHFSFLPQTVNILGSQSYVFGNYSYFISLILGTIIAGGLISVLVSATKERAMGWGDAIVAFFMGLILGWPDVIMALIIAFLSGGLISVILMLLKKKSMKSYLPFAPFLALGALLIILFGDIIIKGYLSLLLI